MDCENNHCHHRNNVIYKLGNEICHHFLKQADVKKWVTCFSTLDVLLKGYLGNLVANILNLNT